MLCSPFSQRQAWSQVMTSYSLEWASIAINSPERNQIWRTGGGNWWDHTYPYMCGCGCGCVCEHIHMHPHQRLGSVKTGMESDWHHADSQTDELKEMQEGSRTERGNRPNTWLKLRRACEVTWRWQPSGKSRERLTKNDNKTVGLG